METNLMIRYLVIGVAALAMAACDTVASLPAVPAAPAPLASTTIDDTALEAAWRGFDLALDAINILGDVGKLKPGTPAGKAVAAGIRRVTASLTAAENFAAAGSTDNYLKALADAKAGIADLRVALQGL